ncbi:MAG: O-antigen ligase family protein [Rikenellaceae bacterium]
MLNNKNSSLDNKTGVTTAILVISLIVISTLIALGHPLVGIMIASAPLMIMLLIAIIHNPFRGFVVLFLLNYFIIVIMRYTNIDGLSVAIDIFIIVIFISYLINLAYTKKRETVNIFNSLTFVTFIWMIYCSLELLNPSAITKTWVLSRGTSYFFILMVLVTFLTFKKLSQVKSILMLLSVLTLIGIAKALIQKHIGFDNTEWAMLNHGELSRTHLLASGTRYFSYYVSAGLFGAVMGHALVVFAIIAIYTKSKAKRTYFIIIALAALYGLMISGTRGALAVPAAGFLLFTLLSKRFKIMIPSLVILLTVYMFLATTTIGQSNAYIRRMRTVFDPNEPSLVVRLNNQKILGKYLADKPFGEGLGLSGVDSKDAPVRFTTSIPTDSWYVKIWVETGIVGLCIYVMILSYIIIYGSYIIMFKIKDKEVKGVLTALLCGTFGIYVSSYGNQILGQFPVVLIVNMSVAIVFMGKYFDNQQTSNLQNIENSHKSESLAK